MTLSILTYNTALLDVRIFNRSVYCPLDSVYQRAPMIARALLSLRPDIICLQEIFHHQLQTLIATQLGHEFPHLTGFTRPGLKARLGNELLTLSRFPISGVRLVRFTHAPMEEKVFTSKGFYHCVVEIPVLGNIDLINFHTTAGGANTHPEHDRMEAIRENQINQILAYCSQLPGVILAGDLNAGPHTSIRNYEQVLQSGFIDAFATVKAEGFSWDPANPLVANGRESHLPAQRIDHIFISNSLSGSLRPVAAHIVLTGEDDITSGTSPLSDHYGVRVEFQILNNSN